MKDRYGKDKVDEIGRWNLLKAEMRPTPKPAKKRPAMNIGRAVEAVCKITPKVKTIPEEISKAMRRPKKSARGAALSAPKNVPAERIETTAAD